MSFVLCEAWCRKAAIRYNGNIYSIAKKRITPIYLTDEVFEHYKRKRATDEAFKKKSEQMSANNKSEVGGSGTGILLHSAGTIFARQHGDTLAELTWRLEEMSTQSPDTSIDEDVVYLEVMPEVKVSVYGLGSQGYHRIISSREASSSRGPAYGPHELEELQRDHQRLQETLLNERMERQDQMQRDKAPRASDTATSTIICYRAFWSSSDDQPRHLTTDKSPSSPPVPSQSAHLDDHQPGNWIDPRRELYAQRWHLVLVLLIKKELARLLYFCWVQQQDGLYDDVGFLGVPIFKTEFLHSVSDPSLISNVSETEIKNSVSDSVSD
ncbi:hypothetical protein Scep_018954 [Stephania cephalantha]|uniref:Uncharacterized protein n=1 Tax=Stephania cephalantha TaxID=152367 RepID=A0AAP0IA70_9MAGN